MSVSTSCRIVNQCQCLYIRAREELLAGHRWLGSHFFPLSYEEYATVRIKVICNYAPDDELDENGNLTLHFRRDAAGNFYNATMRNLFTTMQTMMCHAGFFPDVWMMILLASVAVMDVCMLMGPTSGWSKTEEYHLLLQFQLPFARNIIAYVLRKCKNLVGVMVFGHKAANNILTWLCMNFSQKFLIQNMFLSHPQNIKWRYTLEHARNYVETFRAIMNLLGVDIPPLERVVQLRFLMSKKCTLEMMECVEEFVDGEVLEAVCQRIEMVKIARMAKVQEITEAAEEAAVAAAAKMAQWMKEITAAAAAAAAAAGKRMAFVINAESLPSCILLCSHV